MDWNVGPESQEKDCFMCVVLDQLKMRPVKQEHGMGLLGLHLFVFQQPKLCLLVLHTMNYFNFA